MKVRRKDRESTTQTPQLYVSSLDHIADELQRFDKLIRLCLDRKNRASSENPLPQLSGLVLTHEEISHLISDTDNRMPNSNDPIEAQRLEQEIIAQRAEIDNRVEASLRSGLHLALPRVKHLFQLNELERNCLLICLAHEIDRKYEKLYAYLQDDVTRKCPMVELVLDLSCSSLDDKVLGRACFDARAPLRRFRLIHVVDVPADEPRSLLSRALKLDDRIADFLLDNDTLDGRLDHSVQLIRPTSDRYPSRFVPDGICERMRQFVRAYFAPTPSSPRAVVFHLLGEYGVGREALAWTAAKELGIPLLVADAKHLLAGVTPIADSLWRLARECALQSAALCLRNFDVLLTEDGERATALRSLLDGIETFSQLTFLLGEKPWLPAERLRSRFIQLPLDTPDEDTHRHAWRMECEANDLAKGIDPNDLAGKFRFTPGQIRDAVQCAEDWAHWSQESKDSLTQSDLQRACRLSSNPNLGGMSRKIIPRYGWSEIVLPQDALSQLEEICDQVQHRHIVLGKWGFDRKLSMGKGLSALFSGPPGTGKTMAADVIAKHLGLDLFKIDLSQVVNKYIGETEKNLDRLFNAAEHGNAILFFDEADALFGKRSEVRDSHDRYANLEISYLLQKMEEYSGLAILATNLRRHIDDAFLRRLQFIVEFPFPKPEHRCRIWEVTFPDETPLSEDVDLPALAREVKLAGGNIKNIGLAAAFYAARDGGVVRMAHLIRAAEREFHKLGQSWRWAGKPVELSS